MKAASTRTLRRPPGLTWWAIICAFIAVITAVIIASQSIARAAQPPVGLGTASSFAVLAGSTVTNTGPSVIYADLGVSPGSAVTGFPPGTVLGSIHKADAEAVQAQSDLTTAYNDAAGRTPATSVSGDLTGQTLDPGVYQSASSLGLTGTVTLDAQGDPSAVFIVQVGSTLTTGSSSDVNLTGGAQACNVFWQVGSSATLGTNSVFDGNILALTSITATTGAAVHGRLLARNGAVSLDDNVITAPSCVTTPPTPTPTPTTTTATATPTPTPTGTATPTATPTGTATATPTGTATATATPTATSTMAPPTPTPAPTPTSTSTVVPPTPTPAPTPTPTSTPTETPAPVPTPVRSSFPVTG